jgi:hypothetical protein
MSEEERMALAEEAKSLPIHVQMCAFRHKQIMGKIDAQNKMLKRIAAAAYTILTAIVSGGALTFAEVIPVMRALAGQ